MPGNCQTRVVDTGGVATSILIQKNPSHVDWISVSAQALNTQGLIQIFDGFDDKGTLVWQLEPGYSRHHNFRPPIVLHQGLFIKANAHIASYTVCYCPWESDHLPFREKTV